MYFQNSGFGNSLNPLLSLADKQVYGIPMIVLVGWRGEPGVKDEPQHMKQGEVMEDMLRASKIPHLILCPDENNIRALVKQAFDSQFKAVSQSSFSCEKGFLTIFH